MNAHAVLLDAVETWAADHPKESLNADQLKSLQVVSQDVALDPLRIALLSSTILGNGISPATRDGFLLADLVRCYEKVSSSPESHLTSTELEAFRSSLQVAIKDQLVPDKVEKLLESCYLAPERPPLSSPLTLQTVMQQNRALAAWIASEKGVEDILAALVKGLPKILGDDAPASPFTTAVSAYLELIRGSFNGADAVRHEVGYVVQSLVLPQLRGKSVNEVTTSLKNADWCSTRLRGVAGGGEISFANISPRILPDNALNAPNLAVLSSGVEKAISEAWTKAVESIISSQNVVRFQPDSAPAPLSIRIASSPQADADSELDDYTQDYNGVGVVIRRNDGQWSHANLVELTVAPKPSIAVDNHDAAITAVAGNASEPDAKTFPAAIRTFLPVAVDGRRQLDLDYRGYPLGSPAFSATDAPDGGARENLTLGEAFYGVHDVELATNSDFELPPKLAYGHAYEWAAYNVTKAGSLPSQLQASPEAPWEPIGKIDVTEYKDKVVGETCRRRTAIGAVTFGMQAGQPSRIGKSYSDVEPLAIDAPRVCVTPKTFVDLFRGSDGRGELPTDSIVTFDDIRRYGVGAVPLHIEIHTDPDATSEAAAGVSPISVQIPGGSGTVDISLEKSWLRVRLPDDGADTDTSVTFPHPTLAISGGTEHPAGGSHRRQPPVLLIAEENSEWLGEVSKPALIECALSSVSYLDWEHWTNNASLKVCGIDRTEANFKNAPGTMLLASLVGGLDETGLISKLVQRLPDPAAIGYVIELSVVNDVAGDNEPHRRVVRQTHTIGNGLLSSLNDDVGELKASLDPLFKVLKGVDLANRVRFEVKSVKAEDTLAIMPMPAESHSTGYIVTVPAGVVARLAVRPIVADESVDVGLNNSSSRPIHGGMRQWALGTENVDGTKGLVFEGTELFIEAAATFVDPKQLPPPERRELLQKIYQPLREQVSLNTGGPSRRYDVALKGTFSTQRWARLFSYVDIATQRWRFSGRPIYHWYRPVSDGTSSVVWVDKPDDPKARPNGDGPGNFEWKNFETELFFDRDDVDCDTRRARIGIGGPILQTIHWDNPSATWFRHGCTFVSRYRGLLKTGGRGDRLGPPSGAPWTHRAAMLADSARLTLTRPQVRCHVPLSRAPDDGTTPGETPPLACILEERPFAVGGLAERMLAEVAINPGYAFLKDGQKVGPLDVGREIGRDPRLETWSWMPHRDPRKPDDGIVDQTAQLVLSTEGPVGLHFEQASSPAPAWPNCQYLLRPASLDGGVFVPDETFVGVRMRRALDPAWVVGNAPRDSNAAAPPPFPRQSVKWIEWKITDLQGDKTLLTLKTDDPGRPEVHVVCGYRHKAGVDPKPASGTFTIDRNLIDPQGGSGEIILCQIPLYDREALTKAATATTFKSIVVLHSGAGDGRHVLSILGIPEATNNIAAGRSNAPIVLATVPWVVPKNAETFGLAIGGTPKEVFPLLSSEPTFLEWARTARDAATLYCVDDTAAGSSVPKDDSPQGINERTRPFSMARSALPILATDIEAISNVKNNCASLEFRRRFSDGHPTWIAPPLSVSLQPLGVQRHLVGLFTLPTVEPGRRIDQFRGACRLIGSNPTIPQDCRDATAVRIAELEIPAVMVGSGHPARITTGTAIQSSKDQRFWLHIRFANSPTSMASIKDLKVTVAWVVKDNGNYLKFSATFTPLSGTPEKFVDGVRAVDIVWLTDKTSVPQPATATWHAAPVAANPAALQCHLVEGTTAVWTQAQVTAGVPVWIEVTLAGSDDLWADVSLLHSSPKDASSNPEYFDFDWLFTPLLDTDDDPSVRLNAASLSGLTDAQARIVSISPPIKIHARS
jgi:hypothetical protein